MGTIQDGFRILSAEGSHKVFSTRELAAAEAGTGRVVPVRLLVMPDGTAYVVDRLSPGPHVLDDSKLAREQLQLRRQAQETLGTRELRRAAGLLTDADVELDRKEADERRKAEEAEHAATVAKAKREGEERKAAAEALQAERAAKAAAAAERHVDLDQG